MLFVTPFRVSDPDFGRWALAEAARRLRRFRQGDPPGQRDVAQLPQDVMICVVDRGVPRGSYIPHK